MALGLRGPQYSKLSTTLDDVQLARRLDLPVSVHGGSAAWGKHRPIAQMHERGLLDERTTVVHCNTLADDELQMMADCGCHASLSPDAELQMGFGWPATRRLLDVGIRPSLSIDDCAALCGDMFRTMHTTLIVQRALDNEKLEVPTDQIGLALNSADVVKFATLAGARACGMDREIGTLEISKDGDLLLLRTDELAMFPLTHATGQIVASGHPGLVDTVMVRGRIDRHEDHDEDHRDESPLHRSHNRGLGRDFDTLAVLPERPSKAGKSGTSGDQISIRSLTMHRCECRYGPPTIGRSGGEQPTFGADQIA